MLVGAHLGVADGYPATIEYALEVGVECMQVFAKSPRMWRARPIDRDAAARFAAARVERGLGPLFTHTAYLVNPAADDGEQRAKSVEALADELRRGAALDAEGVVQHIGNDRLGDPGFAAERAASVIVEAFEASGVAEGGPWLLLENTAGAGKAFGSCATDFGLVIRLLPDRVRARVGVCLDTCHAHAAGIDLTTRDAWERVLDDLERECGAGAVRLVHANDCKFKRGARKDRHEWIGEGFLGEAAFEAMMATPRLRTVCAVTEMPGEIPDKDIVNTKRLMSIRERVGS